MNTFIPKVKPLVNEIRKRNNANDGIVFRCEKGDTSIELRPFELHSFDAFARIMAINEDIVALRFFFQHGYFKAYVEARDIHRSIVVRIHGEDLLEKILRYYLTAYMVPSGVKHLCNIRNGVLLPNALLTHLRLVRELEKRQLNMYYTCDALYDAVESKWSFDSTGEQRTVLVWVNTDDKFCVQINGEVSTLKHNNIGDFLDHCLDNELNPSVA